MQLIILLKGHVLSHPSHSGKIPIGHTAFCVFYLIFETYFSGKPEQSFYCENKFNQIAELEHNSA